jgi:hypothetical protein
MDKPANQPKLFENLEDKDFSHLHTFAVRTAPWDSDCVELIINCYDRNNSATWVDGEVIDELIAALQMVPASRPSRLPTSSSQH